MKKPRFGWFPLVVLTVAIWFVIGVFAWRMYPPHRVTRGVRAVSEHFAAASLGALVTPAVISCAVEMALYNVPGVDGPRYFLDTRRISASARHAVLAAWLDPVFPSSEVAYDTRYVAFAGGEDRVTYWQEETRLPPAVLTLLGNARYYLMENARRTLREPARLKACYEKLSPLVIAELAKRSQNEIALVAKWVESATEGMRDLYDPAVQSLLDQYLVCDQTWHDRIWSEWDETTEDTLDLVLAELDTIRARLRETTDYDALLFAYRRQQEGGDALVGTWVRIGEDFQQSLANLIARTD